MKTFVTILLLAASSGAPAADVPKLDPGKLATVTLPLQDWQAVLLSIQDSDRVSARDASRIGRVLVSQIQPQLSQPTAKR